MLDVVRVFDNSFGEDCFKIRFVSPNAITMPRTSVKKANLDRIIERRDVTCVEKSSPHIEWIVWLKLYTTM